jgi:transposase
MSQKLKNAVAIPGIDIGKNSFHVVGRDERRRDRPAAEVVARPGRSAIGQHAAGLIGMEACVGADHLSRKLQMLGHEARLMPAKYVRRYSKGRENFRDAEAIAEACNNLR